MKVLPTAILEVLLIEPKVFGDTRGSYFESANQQKFDALTPVNPKFVLDDDARSACDLRCALSCHNVHTREKLVFKSWYPWLERGIAGDDAAIGVLWPTKVQPQSTGTRKAGAPPAKAALFS